jgi:archaemetzincin
MGAKTGKPEAAPAGLIVPIGPVDRPLLDFLCFALPDSLGCAFRVLDRPLTAEACFDPVRRQWNGARLLEELDALGATQGVARVLGVTSFDLYIPILTFIFGLARLSGRPAVISLHRLLPEFYGLPADPDLVLRRLEKEALHEMGHTVGLKHCDEYSCVMHYSNTVEEVDLKGAAYCSACLAAVAAFSQDLR